MAENVGSIEYIAKINTSQLKADAQTADSTVQSLSQNSLKHTDSMNQGFLTLSKVGIASVATAAIIASVAIIKNLGNAVERVDALNNFPKVMANLGYATDESSKAMARLDRGVRGLPTSLSDIASAMQNIAPTAGSLDEATNITLALNNALLAGGKSAGIQSSAMEQFSQAISKGKPDMMEWRTLATAMPGQLDQIGQSLGYGRGQWQKMAEDVSSGVLPFNKVTEAMVKLNQDGLGQFPSFANQAKNATGGIGTSVANMNTAITRGLAGVITAMQPGLTNALIAVGQGFESVLKQVAGIITFFKQHELATILLTGAMAGLAAAIFVAMIPAMIGLAVTIGAAALAAAPFILAGIVIAGLAYLIMKNWEPLKAWFGSVFSWIGQRATAFVDGFRNQIGTIVTFVGSLPGRIVGAIGNLGSLLVGSGKALIQGFINGIKNMVGALINAVKGAVQAARDFFPFSPAKKGPFSGKGWTAYSGAALMQGMAQGISSNIGAVTGALNTMPALSPAGSIGVSGISDSTGGVINNIGTINISSDVDGERLLKRLGRDDEITSQGVVA